MLLSLLQGRSAFAVRAQKALRLASGALDKFDADHRILAPDQPAARHLSHVAGEGKAEVGPDRSVVCQLDARARGRQIEDGATALRESAIE